MTVKHDSEFLNRLHHHPELRKRFESILDVAEAKVEGPDTADSVEKRVVEEVQQLGAEVISDWGKMKSEKETAAQKVANPAIRNYKKK